MKDTDFKFEIGQDVIVVNLNGSLHMGVLNLGEYIGTKAKIITRVRYNDTYGRRYTLSIPALNYWNFHEFNLEAVEKGFDAEDIISKAFDLGG